MTDDTAPVTVYGSSDVANVLGVQDSTLRKYCIILQDQGYEFLKNEHGHRAFLDKDIIILRKFLTLKNKANMTLTDAAKSVISWSQENNITEGVTDIRRYDTRYNGLLNEFKEFKISQEEFNKELLNQLDKQNKYINERLEKRDNNLMQMMQKSLEQQKELSVLKTKKWWQFWR